MDDKIKNLVLFDIDGTLLFEQSQFLLLKYLYRKKLIGIFYFIRLYFWFVSYKMGFINDPKKVFKYAIRFLKGKSVVEVRIIIDDFVESQMKKYLFTDMQGIIEMHKKEGARMILISNAMDILVESIANNLNINEYIGTKLEVTSTGLYTGRLLGGITYGIQKIVKLRDYLGLEDILIADAVFYTDHHSDIPLLEQVAIPIAVHPTNKLKTIAIRNGWDILLPV